MTESDEFAILCALENPAQMNDLAERLTTSIAQHRLKAPWVPYVLSLSFGVSFLRGSEATLEKLMLEADKKLYAIKEQKKKSPRP